MSALRLSDPPRILLIRRDNIGDLVCTTPVLRALREHFPAARLCVLVNSYNRPVLDNNPDIDQVYAYTKAKHRAPGETVLGIYANRLRTLLALRRENFDLCLPAGASQTGKLRRLAHLIGAKRVIAAPPLTSGHEVERTFRLLAPLGIEPPPPPLRLVANPAEAAALRAQLFPQGRPTRVVGVHISARKPSQRWATENFIALLQRIRQTQDITFLLFWSPGDDTNPLHPGDDAKAQQILRALPGFPIAACPTHHLETLIAGLSLCDTVICSDGGAMHLAAGLGKPILCFFGQSDPLRWHPWGVAQVLLQKPTRDVAEISVEEALEGFERLANS